MPDAMAAARRRRTTLLVVLALVLGVALLSMVAIALLSSQSRSTDELFATILTFALFSLTGLACLPAWRRPGWRVAVVCGLLVSAGSFLVFVFFIWWPPPWPSSRPWQEFTIIAAVVSILLAYLCLTALTRLHKKWRWVRITTQLAAAALALWIIAITLFEAGQDLGMPPLAALIILTLCGTLCVVLLHWLGTLHRTDAVTTPLVLTLTCPRCAESQELAAGWSKCRKCGLTFHIEIEEERCARCGYLLYKLTSDRCPECGTPVFTAVPPSMRPPAVDKGP